MPGDGTLDDVWSYNPESGLWALRPGLTFLKEMLKGFYKGSMGV